MGRVIKRETRDERVDKEGWVVGIRELGDNTKVRIVVRLASVGAKGSPDRDSKGRGRAKIGGGADGVICVSGIILDTC